MACSPNGELTVGASAWQAAQAPEMHLVRGILRLLGRRYYSREVEWLRGGCSHEIVPSPNGDAWLRVAGLEFSPEELVAAMIRHIVSLAQATTKQRVERAVFAVPNMFDQLQRRALLAACELARVNAPFLLSASSAAAMVCPMPNTQRIATLDFGAGHFDAALMERVADRWTVAVSVGDGLLGGMDFDCRVAELLRDDVDLERRCLSAERLRHALSEADRVDVAAVSSVAVGTHGKSVVTRAEHDEAVGDELGAVAPPCGWLLEDAGLGTDDVDQVLLFGGMAAVPAVRAEVRELFGKEPLYPEGGDTMVARGALACAGELAAGVEARSWTQLSTRSLGVKVRGGLMRPVVPRVRRFPWRSDTAFAAPGVGQPRIVFEVYEGDAQHATDNLYLGSFVLENLQSGLAPTVTFCLDDNGVFQVPSWRAGEQSVAINFRWAGGSKQLPVRQPRLGDEYARLSPTDDDDPPTNIRVSRDSAAQGTSAATAEDTRRPPRPAAGSPPTMDRLPSGDALLGTTVGGCYQIESVIAEGGMGRVYRATHQALGRKFAVKVLHPELASNADLATRFLREAQSAGRIDSDHVVDIVHFGRLDDGTSYFVMEYLEGSTLRDMIDGPHSINVDLARDIGIQLADGVAAAHALDIVHRDLKPDNVVLIRRPRRPFFAKILDFGIARHPTSQLDDGPITMDGCIIGSPSYISPEQIIGGAITARTDIYVLGVVLYEMVAGVPPFVADSIAHLLQQHVDAAPPPLRQHDRAVGCPESLERVISQCLAKKAEDRIASAVDLAKALSQAV